MQTELVKPAVYHDRQQQPVAQAKPSLVSQIASKYGVDPEKMLATLKATAFRQSGNADSQVTNEQMMMLLVVANEYNLNPFTRELYAFASKGGIVPIVSIDGWVRIVNEKPQFRGVAFEYGPPHSDPKFHGAPEWIQCTMVRSDRDVPVAVREYLVECYRSTDPWNTTTARMLRHRAYIQCGRIAFGFALHDEDEAQRIIEGEASRVPEVAAGVARINAAVTGKQAPAIDGASERVDENTGAAEGKAGDEPATNGGKKQEAGPTYAEVRNAIDKAKNADAVDAAEAMVDSLAENFRPELHALAQTRRAALAK